VLQVDLGWEMAMAGEGFMAGEGCGLGLGGVAPASKGSFLFATSLIE